MNDFVDAAIELSICERHFHDDILDGLNNASIHNLKSIRYLSFQPVRHRK